MKGIVKKIAPASIAALVTLGLNAPAASAQGDQSVPPTAVGENSATNIDAVETSHQILDMPEPEEGSVFDTVANASDTEEQRAILEAEGFEATTGPNGEEQYEQTVDGITVGWTIEPATEQDGIAPMWSVGWQQGPYVAATVEQWQSAASLGTGIGGIACGLIANVFGGMGCAAAALAASEAIDAYDPGAAGNACFAVQPVGGYPINVFPVASC